MDWEKISAQLEKPLDRKHVKPPPRGKYGNYIEAWHAQAEANRIFGHGNWSQQIVCMDLVNEEPAKLGEDRRDGWKVTYVARVRITVDGRITEDEGSGDGANQSKGEAHASARKEAVSDAVKRCLKAFGWPFGLALYDSSGAHVADTDALERAAKEEAEAQRLIANLGTCTSREEGDALYRDTPREIKAREDFKAALRAFAEKYPKIPDNPIAAK